MFCLFISPWHQQLWYWVYGINKSVTSMRGIPPLISILNEKVKGATILSVCWTKMMATGVKSFPIVCLLFVCAYLRDVKWSSSTGEIQVQVTTHRVSNWTTTRSGITHRSLTCLAIYINRLDATPKHIYTYTYIYLHLLLDLLLHLHLRI